jgi:hypothetical protein
LVNNFWSFENVTYNYNNALPRTSNCLQAHISVPYYFLSGRTTKANPHDLAISTSNTTDHKIVCIQCELVNVAINHFLQVTRDIKMFLGKQANGTEEDKSILSIELEVAVLKGVRWQLEYCR